METPELFAAAVLLVSYALIVTEKVHRTVAALAGGALIITLGPFFGLIDREEYPSEIHFMSEAVDWNTIGLLLGMMIIVGILKDTGIFEFIAVKTAKLSRGDPWRIMLLFATTTAILSAFLDNVTTVLLIAPVTVSITLSLKLNPVPFLISEVLASNIGGTATLIGDPPNIIIGSGAGLSFNDFIVNLGPIVLVVFGVSLLFFKYVFRSHLSQKPENIEEVLAMNEWDQIKDPVLLKKSLAVLGFVILLFFLHSALHLEPSTVALLGAALLLLITMEHPDRALHQVEWGVLLFFAGLFVIVKGVEEAGLIEEVAMLAVDLTGGNLVVAMFVILWVSAVASAIIDNIPFTATMVPLVHSMSTSPELAAQIAQLGGNPLWWALALGACLGGNGTLIGASANVVVAGISERMGYPISFKEFLKYGAPLTFITVFISGILLYVKTFTL
ncbi:MAG: ArsB/NhaD family transporter [Euryarchaeota archaeon]|nr:ArsB/NhaD family transporter [Euryarchaeota archaeon]